MRCPCKAGVHEVGFDSTKIYHNKKYSQSTVTKQNQTLEDVGQ